MARHVPCARRAHGDAGEVDAPAIAVELANRNFERGHGLRFHLAVPLLSKTALRKDDDRFVTVGETLERRGKTDRQLPFVVVSPLIAAVKKKNHRPVMYLRVMRRQPDAVAIAMSAHDDRSLEKRRPR